MGKQGIYKMGTIARRSGFSPALLRAWEARHGLLVPERGAGGHRAYTEDDLRVLRRVRVLLDEGRAIGEVALLGRAALLAGGLPEENGAPAPIAAARDSPAPAGLATLREAVVRAAVALDSSSLEAALDEAFARVSPDAAIRDVVEPAARDLGNLWAAGRCSVAVEHLASAAFSRRIDGLRGLASASPSAPPVVCACFPDEDHALGALVVAFQMGRAGVRAIYLGARLPFEDLERAFEDARPVAAFLSVTRVALFDAHRPRLFELLGRWSGLVRIFIGGQGAPEKDEAVTRAGATLWPRSRPLADVASALFGERPSAARAPPPKAKPRRRS